MRRNRALIVLILTLLVTVGQELLDFVAHSTTKRRAVYEEQYED